MLAVLGNGTGAFQAEGEVSPGLSEDIAGTAGGGVSGKAVDQRRLKRASLPFERESPAPAGAKSLTARAGHLDCRAIDAASGGPPRCHF